MVTIIDEYSDTNADGTSTVQDLTIRGQTITGNGDTVNSVTWYLEIAAGTGLSGDLFAEIYSITGTHGTDGEPNTLLATSDPVDVTTISQSGSEAVQFTFSGGNKIVLSDSTNYCLAIHAPSTTLTGTAFGRLNRDTSSPAHDGNPFYSNNDGSSYFTFTTYDHTFLLNGDDPLSTIQGVSSIQGLSTVQL